MSIVEIENAIKDLSPEKVNELMEWFVSYYSEIWDKQIHEDLEMGRLDSILEEVDSHTPTEVSFSNPVGHDDIAA